MKTASVTFLADGTMSLTCGDQIKHFDSVSRLLNYCRDNGIEVTKTDTIE